MKTVPIRQIGSSFGAGAASLTTAMQIEPEDSTVKMRIGFPGASGITLIELLIVMSLLSLAAAFAGPAVGAGLETMSLRSTVLQVASNFRRVQADARAQQRTLAIRVANGELVLVSDDGTSRVLELNAGITLAGADESTYLFYGSGQISGPARLEFENRRGRRMALVLGPEPGHIDFDEGGAASGGAPPFTGPR